MPLFGRRRDTAQPATAVEASRFTGPAAALGLEPDDDSALDTPVQDAIHESVRVLYGDTPRPISEKYPHPTRYHDVFRQEVDGRTVVVANGWTNVKHHFNESADDVKGVSICLVELPSFTPIACVQPRGIHEMMRTLPESPTGNAAFDQRFRVRLRPGIGESVITPDMQRLIMARDDWIFRGETYRLVCTAKDPFESVDDMRDLIDEVLAIVAAIPTTVLASHVDHSEDDLVARISRLESVDDAIAFLEELSPSDRERLAQSGTPLAMFADVTTPEEAMTRFQSLDQQRQFELITMFTRVQDGN